MAEISCEQVGAVLYERDYCARTMGMRLDSIAAGTAVMSMRVRPEMANGHAICHGGMIFALADTAFAYACNAGNQVTVASGASIQFLEPARSGETLVASCRRVHERGRSGVYDTEVRTGDGRLIALFRGQSRRLEGAVIPPVENEEKQHG